MSKLGVNNVHKTMKQLDYLKIKLLKYYNGR